MLKASRAAAFGLPILVVAAAGVLAARSFGQGEPPKPERAVVQVEAYGPDGKVADPWG